MNRFLQLIFLIMALGWTACDKGEPIDYVDPEQGREYFPLIEGSSWTYKIDSFRYDLKSGNEIVIDTTQSFLNCRVVSKDELPGGGFLVDVERYYRRDEQSSWIPIEGVEYQVDEDELLKTEGNVTLQLAVFPMTADRTWNPTRYADPNLEIYIKGEPVEMFKYWSGRISQLDSTGTVLGQEDVELLEISLADFSSLIELRQVEEVYAKDIGLVSRELWILDTQCEQLGGDPIACDGMPWDEIANRGFILKQELVAYE